MRYEYYVTRIEDLRAKGLAPAVVAAAAAGTANGGAAAGSKKLRKGCTSGVACACSSVERSVDVAKRFVTGVHVNGAFSAVSRMTM